MLDFARRNEMYHRGRYVEGKWVFGGICRETKACFLVLVERRDKDTLIPIIRAQILPEICVMSDMWKAYDCLQDKGYNHLTVNHSLNFVDPDTGAHTQRIENTRWGIKRSIPRTGILKDLFDSDLQEWLWRKQYGEDPLGVPTSSINLQNAVKFNADLQSVLWNIAEIFPEVHDKWFVWQSPFSIVFDEHFPICRKHARKPTYPWLDKSILVMMRRRDQFHRKARKFNRPLD